MLIQTPRCNRGIEKKFGNYCLQLLLNVIEEEENSVVSQLEEKPGRLLLDNTSLGKYWTKYVSAVMEKKKNKLKIN
jgi:hypothetical protein